MLVFSPDRLLRCGACPAMELFRFLVISTLCSVYSIRVFDVRGRIGDVHVVGEGSSALLLPLQTAYRQETMPSTPALDTPGLRASSSALPWAPLQPRPSQLRMVAELSDAGSYISETDRTPADEFAKMLPLGWGDKFTNFREAPLGDRRHHGTVMLADLVSDPGFTAAFAVEPTDSEQTYRESVAAQRLALFRNDGVISAAHVLHYYDFTEEGGRTFFMTEAAERSLEQVVSKMQFPEVGEDGDRSMRLVRASTNPSTSRGRLLAPNSTVPILIDLLRGCEELEDVGILHSELSMENVVVLDGRAVIGGLGACCILRTDSDRGAGFGDLRDSRNQSVGTVFVQAPEVVDSVPCGPKNHVWSAGLIFARMSLGFDVVVHRVIAEAPSFPKVMDSTKESREQVREIIRDSFQIDFAPGFDALHPEVRRLLMGMLQKDPRDRWSTGIALEQVEAAAKALEAQVPPARVRLELPDAALGTRSHTWMLGPDFLDNSWE
mmetsp:Transcript_23006/g.66690  ORF Transcript_23006/g.66690 Transcript_23006/m.66690 type:complete len:493 (-) Transcript_23006:153-1631(-)